MGSQVIMKLQSMNFLRKLILLILFSTGINPANAQLGFGDEVDVFCAGMSGFESPPVYGVVNCAKCHNPGDNTKDRTEAYFLYKNNNKSPSQALCDIEAPPPPPTTCTDNDLDSFSIEGGVCGEIDCNDNDPAINPAALELCSDGIDNNCNMLIDTLDMTAVDCPKACNDADNDMFSPDGGVCGMVDCNDNDAAINPGAIEVCSDNIDNNCNYMIDTAEPSCPVVNPPADPIDPLIDAEMIKAKLKQLTMQIEALKDERKILKKQLEKIHKKKQHKKYENEDENDKYDVDEEDDEDQDNKDD
jgi:hypothetical protein